MSEAHDVAQLVTQHRLLKHKPLTTEVGLRIRPDVLGQGEQLPALRYETINTENDYHLGGAAGSGATRLQIDAYGASRLEANRVAAIVEDLLDGWAGEYIGPDNEVWIYECTRENQWDMVDQPTAGSNAHRYIRKQDYLIHHTKPLPSLTPLE